MSMDFQRGLVNSPFALDQAVASEVANLSLITLRPAHYEGGWLHSHAHRYPIYPSGDQQGLVSSYQQQVALPWTALRRLSLKPSRPLLGHALSI